MLNSTRGFRSSLILGGITALAFTTAGQAQVGPGWVLSHQKISDTEGGFTGTLEDGDDFAYAAGLGDLDGDGVEDLAVGTGWDDDGGPNRGAVYVLFLNTDGTVKSHQKISDTQGGFTGVLEDFDDFGFSVASLGDLDGDLVTDLVVGTERDDDGGTNRGAVYVLFLNTNGTVKAHQKISDTEGGFTGTLDNVDLFGAAVAPLGDLDGDGTIDLAVGACRDDDGGISRGAVWVLFLNPDGTVKSHQKISDVAGNFSGALQDLVLFGRSVTALEDLDGDGVVDLAVGAPETGLLDYGAVWILFLNTDGTVKSHQKISNTAGEFSGPLDPEGEFGYSVAALGDLDVDGTVDLAVGAWEDDDGGPDRGAVWVLFLNSDGTVKSHQKISDTEGGFTGLDDSDRFATTISPLGDLNDDGVLDLAVGSTTDDDGGAAQNADRGAVYVLFLTEGVTAVHDLQVANRAALGSHLVGGVPNPFNPRTRIHYDLARPGDATIRIYDVAGRLVRRFDLSDRPVGANSVDWNGKDDQGRTVASATYLVRLVTADARDALQVTFIK